MRHNVLPVVLAALVCAACASRPPAPGPVLPRSAELREYVIPWENAYPGDVAVDTAGRVWFTDRLRQAVAVLDPESGEFQSYAVPTRGAGPYGLIAVPDGGIWFAQSQAGSLARLDPVTGRINEFPIDSARGGPHLLTWRDGEIWFGMRDGRGFGRLDVRTGRSAVYFLQRDRPYSLAATANAVWISSFDTFRLLEVDPATGAVQIHDLVNVPVTPFGGSPEADNPRQRWRGEVRRITSDGSGVWFTDFVRSRVARYDPAAGSIVTWESLERDAEPYGIARSSRGAIWYGERGGNRITILDPYTGERLRVTVPTPGAYARHIVLDEKRGRAWIPFSETGRLAVIEYR